MARDAVAGHHHRVTELLCSAVERVARSCCRCYFGEREHGEIRLLLRPILRNLNHCGIDVKQGGLARELESRRVRDGRVDLVDDSVLIFIETVRGAEQMPI